MDPRGGHNRGNLNKKFFKTWSPSMAYVLGYIFADGTLINSKPSRTCYLRLTSVDKELLEKVNSVLERDTKIYTIKPRMIEDGPKTYLSQTAYRLSVGSREIFSDLLNLGLTERKSLTVTFPGVPKEFLSYFLRGNFDGDGCVYIQKDGKRLQVIFNSGSAKFLRPISLLLSKQLCIGVKRPLFHARCYQIRYSTKEALKILKFMYRNLNACPYLERKYKLYEKWRGTQVVRDLPAKQPCVGSIPTRASKIWR